jgi:NNP family nitrate/nitrite transporter-like MFS transporter
MKGGEKSALALSALGYFLGFAGVALFGPLAVVFKPLLQLSPLTLGLFVAIPTLTGALLRIPFGALVDKYGGKRPMLVLLALSSGGLLGLSVLLLRYYPSGISPGSLPLMLLIGGLVGAGIATSSVSLVQTSYWFPPDKLGGALGLCAGIGNTAPGFFTLLLPVEFAALGLAGSYLVWFAIVAGGAILYWALAQDPYQFQLSRLRQGRGRAPETGPASERLLNQPGRFTKSLWESARMSENWALVATNFASFGGFLALTSWLPTYWAVYHGLSLPVAAFLTAVGFTLFGAFMRVLGGFASDLHGGDTVQLLNHALMVVGALTLFLSGTSLEGSILGELVLAAGMGMANGGVYKLIPRYMPETLGGAMGWVGGVGSLGGFVIPPILGLAVGGLGDVGYSQGFALFVGLGLMSFAISLWLRARRHDKLGVRPRPPPPS